ncbi:acyltransferase family protein [Paenibacillus rhizoplanae]
MTSGHTWGLPLQELGGKFFKYLWTGTAYTHLYYIIIIIQFYLLFPLILWCLQKVRPLAAWAPVIGLALQWGFVLLNKYMVNHGYWKLSKGSLAITYFSYFLLGAAIAIYYSSLKKSGWFPPAKAGAPVKGQPGWYCGCYGRLQELGMWYCGITTIRRKQ